MEDDEDSYGAGTNQNRKSRKYQPASKAAPEKEPVLTEDDEDYPKDVPKGAKKYQKFWTVELREVTHQGSRRSCWTIASTRSFSARLLIERKVDHPIHLSALHLMVGLFAETDEKGALKNLTHLQDFLKSNGTLLEDDCKCKDPFSEAKAKGIGCSKKEAPPLCTYKGQPKRAFKVEELKILDEVDEKELILLLDKGPVAVTIEIDRDFEKFKGGIYTGPKSDGKKLDKHMILLTGYGTYKKQHYWLGQNSFGVGWGEEGYIKIIRQVSREKGQPSLITRILYPVLLDREAYNP